MRAIAGVIGLVSRVLLGVAFCVAGGIKIEDPQSFAESIKGVKIVPAHASEVIVVSAFVLPWMEIIAGVLLIIGLWARPAALTAAGSLVIFIGAIWSVMYREMSVKCGCFGKLSPFCEGELGMCNIYQNLVLLGLAAAVLGFGAGFWSLDWRAGRRRGAAGAIGVDPSARDA